MFFNFSEGYIYIYVYVARNGRSVWDWDKIASFELPCHTGVVVVFGRWICGMWNKKKDTVKKSRIMMKDMDFSFLLLLLVSLSSFCGRCSLLARARQDDERSNIPHLSVHLSQITQIDKSPLSSDFPKNVRPESPHNPSKCVVVEGTGESFGTST